MPEDFAQVPVRIGSAVVGRAVVFSKGNIALYLRDNEQTREIYEVLLHNLARGISIQADCIPAVPSELPE